MRQETYNGSTNDSAITFFVSSEERISSPDLPQVSQLKVFQGRFYDLAFGSGNSEITQGTKRKWRRVRSSCSARCIKSSLRDTKENYVINPQALPNTVLIWLCKLIPFVLGTFVL